METLAFGLFLKRTSEGLEITGKTYDSKERLREMGAKWSAEKRLWMLPLEADISSLAYVAPPPRKRMPRAPRPEPTTRYLYSDRVYICAKKVPRCNDANPQGPMMYVCDCHPTFYSSYDGT